MKNSILSLLVVTALTLSSFTVFSQENEDAAKARKEIAAANKKLTEAKIDSPADFEQFKKDAELKIQDNQSKIDDLKSRSAELSSELKKNFNKEVAKLEQKNKGLQKKIAASARTKTTRWTAFKREFSRDMKDVTDAIRQIGVNSNQ